MDTEGDADMTGEYVPIGLKGGFYAELTAPMAATHEGAELDLGSFHNQLRFVEERGAGGILVRGYLSDFCSLTHDESLSLYNLSKVVEGLKVIAHVSALSLHDTIRLAIAAKHNGADAICATPLNLHYLAPEEVVSYYRLLSATKIPMYIYAHSSITCGRAYPLEDILINSPTVVGMIGDFEGEENLETLMQIGSQQRGKGGFEALNCVESMVKYSVHRDLAIVSPYACAWPEVVGGLIDEALQGDKTSADAKILALYQMRSHLGRVIPRHPRTLLACQQYRAIIRERHVRPPLLPLTLQEVGNLLTKFTVLNLPI